MNHIMLLDKTKARIRLVVAIAVTMLGSLVGWAGQGNAFASGSNHHCVIIVGKSSSYAQISPERYRYCSYSQAAAIGHLRDRQTRSTLQDMGIYSSTILMYWYDDANLSGFSTTIYGDDGTCDAAGYTVYTGSQQPFLTSADGYWKCNKATFTHDPVNFTSWFPTNMPANLNDDVHVIHVWYATS